MNINWQYTTENINWDELRDVIRLAPLGERDPEGLRISFENSMFCCFVFDDTKLIAAGRALADGYDCSYICDVVVLPDYQGQKIGKAVVEKLMDLSKDHKKIILFASIGKEGFYKKLGFLKMNTAMAIFENMDRAVELGFLEGS